MEVTVAPMKADARSAIDSLEARVVSLLDSIEVAASGVGNVDAFFVSQARNNLRVGFALLKVAVGSVEKVTPSSVMEPQGQRIAVAFSPTTTSTGVSI